MNCEYCGQLLGHHPRCPLYKPAKATHYCSSCGEGIRDGEEYIENEDGECIHWECFTSMKDLLEFLGYEILTMEENKLSVNYYAN